MEIDFRFGQGTRLSRWGHNNPGQEIGPPLEAQLLWFGLPPRSLRMRGRPGRVTEESEMAFPGRGIGVIVGPLDHLTGGCLQRLVRQ